MNYVEPRHKRARPGGRFAASTPGVPFINGLPSTDPLFVFETNPALAELVDGFSDPTHRFVGRSVPHVLSMKTSIAPDTGDGSSNPPIQRTGWAGDGAPDNGSLRSFLSGAIAQHYTKRLERVPGVDFRLPTALELDLVNEMRWW